MNYTLIIVMCALSLVLLYGIYQFFRNEAVFRIRSKWIENRDSRWYEYTYDYMFDPSEDNWFGLRYPRDEHYNRQR